MRIWDLGSDAPAASGRVLADLDEGPASGLALSKDHRWLLTRTTDGARARIFLRDLASNQGKRELPEEDWLDGSQPFSPGSRWLVTIQAGVPVLRDLKTFQVRTLVDREIQALAFTRDERRLAMALQDGPISLWRLTPQGPDGRLVELPESRGRVEGMIFGQDGLSLFAVEADETVRAWRAAPGEPMAFTLALKDPETTRGIREGSRPRIELSPNGRLLMSTGEIQGTRLWRIGESFELLMQDSQTSIAGFSAEGRWLLFGIGQKIVLVDDVLGEEIVRVQSQPLRLATSGPNGRWLVTHGGQEAPRIWDARRGLTIADLEPATRLAGSEVLALHENGRHMLVESDSEDLELWDLTGRAAPRKLPASQQAFDRIKANRRDDPRLGNLAGGVDPWRLDAYRQGLGTPLDFSSTRVAVGTDEGSIVLWDIPADGEIRPPARLQGPEGSVADVALSPGGRWLAGGYFNGGVCLWDLRNHRAAPKRLISHRHPVTALAFGPEESSLATAGSEGTVRLYDLSGEEPRAKLVLDKDTRMVTALTISRDGSWLAIARLGGVELRTLEESIRLENTGSHVVELVFSPDRHRLVGYGIEDDARIWYLDGDRPNPAPVLLARSDLKIRALAFSPDGRRLVTASDKGIVRRWALGLEELLKIACEAAGRDLTREEWEEHLPSEPFRNGQPCSASPGR
ncbi:MAG TPA: hypothetical protein VE685_24070 [Thermoanaerobaculia bacterium]|nr:hypothetical protein [Thermoanaerobaculia bacterium]